MDENVTMRKLLYSAVKCVDCELVHMSSLHRELMLQISSDSERVALHMEYVQSVTPEG
jgi:hypothetical protein